MNGCGEAEFGAAKKTSLTVVLQDKPSVIASRARRHQPGKSILPLLQRTCSRMHFQERSPEPALLAEYTKDFIPVGIAEMFTLTTEAKVTLKKSQQSSGNCRSQREFQRMLKFPQEAHADSLNSPAMEDCLKMLNSLYS